MASVLVHIEADGLEPTDASLRVLGEGRRIATSLGATLYAHVQLEDGEIDYDELAAVLGRAGADKAVVSRGPAPPGPQLWASHGPALAEACADLRPLVVMLVSGPGGSELGPRLAATLGAAFMAEPQIERGSRDELVFSRAVFGATYRRRLSAEDLEQTLVVTLPARGFQVARGNEDAELRIAEPTTPAGGVDHKGVRADAGAGLEDARVVVIAGAGVDGFETFALVESLADALGGVVGATRSLCAKGVAPPDREVGVGGRPIAPDLVVFCGASGSSASLGAIVGDPDVIAIDRDPDAPIFRVADYGLIGDLALVLPELIRALRTQRNSAAVAP